MTEKSVMSVQELARQMGISLPMAYELVKEPGFPTIHIIQMKKQDVEAINTMRLQGKSPAEIAWVLGISVNTVRSHIRRHPELEGGKPCKNCGRPISTLPGRKEKTVLLGSVLHDLVEQPPGTGSEESILSSHLHPLWKGV